MIGRWPDLRDHYLPTLLGTVRKVNPVVPVRCHPHSHSRVPIERPYLPNPLSVPADPGYLPLELPRFCIGRGILSFE